MPTFAPTAQITNPPKPEFIAADFDLVDMATMVGDINEVQYTDAPTKTPTSYPTHAGYVVHTFLVEVPLIEVPAIAFPLAYATADHPLMRLSLIEGFANALGMDEEKVAISSLSALRRRLAGSTSTAIAFQVESVDRPDQVAQLKDSIAASALEGSLVANVQKSAATRGVLTPELRNMERSLTIDVSAMAKSTKTVEKTEMRRTDSFAPTSFPTAPLPTPPPTPNPTPYPTSFPTTDFKTGSIVRSTVSINGISGDTFASSTVYATAFRVAIAAECGVDSSKVTISTMEDMSTRRRLLDAVAIESTVSFDSLEAAQSGHAAIRASLGVDGTFGGSFETAFNEAAVGTNLEGSLTNLVLSYVLTDISDAQAFTDYPTAAPTPTPTMAPTTLSQRMQYETGFTKNELAALLFCLFIGILVMIAGAVYLFKKHQEAGKAAVEAYKSTVEDEPVKHGELDSELGDQASMDVVAIDV